MSTYKNMFTLDGRLSPRGGIKEADVKRTQALLEAALAGDIMADARLREDAGRLKGQFALAHLINLQFIPQLEKIGKSIAPFVGAPRMVKDFNPVVLQSMYGELVGAGIGEHGEASVVPEGTNYPKVSVSGAESFYAKLAKRGVSIDFLWEQRINDTVGFYDGLPERLLDLTQDTEYFEVMDALLSASQSLPAVTLPDGTSVAADAPATPNGIMAAIIALSERKINGRGIGTLSGYNVIVPTGRKIYVEYALKQAMNIASVQDGAITFNAPDTSILATVSVEETDRLSGTEWILQPKPGATRRPVLDILKLRGYETPELRVKADAGIYVGGGAVDPLEGSFDTDAISYRYRYVVGGVLWDDTWIVRSTGQGQ